MDMEKKAAPPDKMKEKLATMTCITCPQGCTLELFQGDAGYEVTGNTCKKGKAYAIQEYQNPMRSITSTVKTAFRDFPRLSVKTDGEVPLKDIFLFMEEINKVFVKKKLKTGQVVLKNMRKSGVNLVATNDMP